MPGHRSFNELRDKMPAESSRRVKARVEATLEEMRLSQLREAQDVTQTQIGESLDVKQAAVSRLENRSDMYVSSLQEYVRALGGELELIAVFPAGTIRLTQFQTKADR